MLCVSQKPTTSEPDVPDAWQDEAALDGFPVLATTPHWRALMKSRREALKLDQHEVAKAARVSQNVIHKIEKGQVRRSKAVLPICNFLKIPPPMAVFEDEIDQKWHDLGRRYRAADLDGFKRKLVGLEAELNELAAQVEADRAGH